MAEVESCLNITPKDISDDIIIDEHSPSTTTSTETLKLNSKPKLTKHQRELQRIEREKHKAERREQLETERLAREIKKREREAEREAKKQEAVVKERERAEARAKRDAEREAKRLENELRERERAEAREKRRLEQELREREADERRARRDEERARKEAERARAEETKRLEQDELERLKAKQTDVLLSFFKKPDSVEEALPTQSGGGSIFMPYEPKKNSRLAPLLRVSVEAAQLAVANVDSALLNAPPVNERTEASWLDLIKCNRRRSDATYRRDPAVEIISVATPTPPRAKLLQFSAYAWEKRPAYWGSWRKRSAVVRPRRPFATDTTHLDYEYDSCEEWEEGDGEDIDKSDRLDSQNDDDGVGDEADEDEEGFLVPHGYLSDDEGGNEDDVPPEVLKARQQAKAKQWELDRQRRLQPLKPVCCGLFYRSALEPASSADSQVTTYPEDMFERFKYFQTIFLAPPPDNYFASEPTAAPPTELSPPALERLARTVHLCTDSADRIVEQFRLDWLAETKSTDLPDGQKLGKGLLHRSIRLLAKYKSPCWRLRTEYRHRFAETLREVATSPTPDTLPRAGPIDAYVKAAKRVFCEVLSIDDDKADDVDKVDDDIEVVLSSGDSSREATVAFGVEQCDAVLAEIVNQVVDAETPKPVVRGKSDSPNTTQPFTSPVMTTPALTSPVAPRSAPRSTPASKKRKSGDRHSSSSKSTPQRTLTSFFGRATPKKPLTDAGNVQSISPDPSPIAKKAKPDQ